MQDILSYHALLFGAARKIIQRHIKEVSESDKVLDTGYPVPAFIRLIRTYLYPQTGSTFLLLSPFHIPNFPQSDMKRCHS